MFLSFPFQRDFFLDKQREKAKLEAEMKLIVTMKQLIPAGEASREGSLGVILSQYHIASNEFCPDFNNKTIKWTPGVLLPTKVVKGLRAKEYKLYISSPSVPFLIDAAIDENDGRLYITSFYDAILFHAKELKRPVSVVAQMFFSSLRAKHIRRIQIKEKS